MALISNPPYNMAWEVPPFADMQERFKFGVPPKGNANYAFILSALEKQDRCIFILPAVVLTGGAKQEKEIRKQLIDNNFVDAVVMCPDRMFESTSIPVVILVLDKNKKDTYVSLIDMSKTHDVEIRKQKGQFGAKSHTNRVYEKKVNVFNDDNINQILSIISERKNIKDISYNATVTEIQNHNYNLNPGVYFEVTIDDEEGKHRPIEDIINDINRVLNEKSACKLTINETLAKAIGFDLELYKQNVDFKELNELLKKLNIDEIKTKPYFVCSKNKNEIKFENNSKEICSSVLLMIMSTWKQHIYYLNNEENRLLAELRDCLLPKLMSGKFEEYFK